MTARLTVGLAVESPGIGVVSLPDGLSAEELGRALVEVGDEALRSGVLHRLEAQISLDDGRARRALLRSGFRHEGVRRQARRCPDGQYEDLVMFSRLTADETSGPQAFTSAMNSVLPRTRVIAHVALRDTEGRFLLCRTTFKPDWELPGGIVERHEAPRAGAIREIEEELGVTRRIGPLLLVDWMPPYLGWDDALELIFDGGVVSAAELAGFRPDGHEITEVGFFDLAAAQDVVTPLSHRRLTVIAGLSPGEVRHTEGGHPVG